MATAAKKQIQIQPLDDRLVVKRLEAEEKTSGGILLPENAKEKPQQAKVLAVGPGKLLDDGTRSKPDIAEGDTVLFGKYSGSEITVDGDEVIILRESDVLAKLG
jgi:chaperonin GroES